MWDRNIQEKQTNPPSIFCHILPITVRKISKDTVQQNCIINQMALTVTENQQQYSFSSCLLGTFIQTDHILSHKTHLNKIQNIETRQSVLSDYKRNKKFQKTVVKFSDTCFRVQILENEQCTSNQHTSKSRSLTKNVKIF